MARIAFREALLGQIACQMAGADIGKILVFGKALELGPFLVGDLRWGCFMRDDHKPLSGGLHVQHRDVADARRQSSGLTVECIVKAFRATVEETEVDALEIFAILELSRECFADRHLIWFWRDPEFMCRYS